MIRSTAWQPTDIGPSTLSPINPGIAVSYFLATGVSCTLALGLGRVVKRATFLSAAAQQLIGKVSCESILHEVFRLVLNASPPARFDFDSMHYF